MIADAQKRPATETNSELLTETFGRSSLMEAREPAESKLAQRSTRAFADLISRAVR
jgi:hypothetical protein